MSSNRSYFMILLSHQFWNSTKIHGGMLVHVHSHKPKKFSIIPQYVRGFFLIEFIKPQSILKFLIILNKNRLDVNQ